MAVRRQETTRELQMPSKRALRRFSPVVRRPFSLIVIPTVFLFLLPAAALAQCTAPSDPGVRICSPTLNATLAYPAFIDFNSTPAFGTEIVKYSVYDNDHKIFESSGGTGATLGDGDGTNGFHRVVINAWDGSGKLYQSAVSFRVVGDGFPVSCPAPSSPGINFCVPPAGAVLGTNYPVVATATSQSKIAAMRLYVDGKSQGTLFNVNRFTTGEGASVNAQGDHTVAIVAWDTAGHVFNSTRTIHSTYTYGFYDCPPEGPGACTPGFYSLYTMSPVFNSYVGNSFTIKTEIRENPRPITEIKAYIDSKVVATSDGPMIVSPVENAPTGTHILTLQAWDTAGVLYRIQFNININVPH